jgi:adenylate cyclase
MPDVFISYARSTARQAHEVAEGLRAMGYDVWRDDDLPAHRAYAEVIEERLQAAKAVVVIWSVDAVRSDWVQSEADTARTGRKLVQMTVDGAKPPRPFDRIQCADLRGWTGETNAHEWRKVVASVGYLVGDARPPTTAAPDAAPRRLSICVLPFSNMSGDPEQEYFSDGISEDIVTDLSKVAALLVIARNTAFTFKGKGVDVTEVAARLNVSHVLEGSVRKAGNRVRITAQLIDGASGGHVWAERYDRDLDDIFALQDEISEAIVAALKLKLLPREKQAIERRGTDSVEAYDLYLMARSYYLNGNNGDPRTYESLERLCRRVVEIDPGYAQAWALLATGQFNLRRVHGRSSDEGEAALERALALDPDLAEARALRARMLSGAGRHEAAAAEIAVALRLDPESYEVNLRAANISYGQGRVAEAAPFYEKAVALVDTDLSGPHMLISCYTALGDKENTRRVAEIALRRAEKALVQDPSNSNAMETGVTALAARGERVRAQDWMRRALLIDPDNLQMRYNFACALPTYLDDPEAALEMLRPVLERDAAGLFVRAARADPDFASLRGDPRFEAMLAAAERRLAKAASGDSANAGTSA